MCMDHDAFLLFYFRDATVLDRKVLPADVGNDPFFSDLQVFADPRGEEHRNYGNEQSDGGNSRTENEKHSPFHIRIAQLYDQE